MQRTVLVAALAIAMIVDGFFALVNFYPVAPHRARSARLYVYADLDPAQARWYQENVLDEFNTEHNVDLRLQPVSEDNILSTLAEAKRHGTTPLLAVLPAELATRAIRDRFAHPFDDVVSPAQLSSDFAEIRPELMAAGRIVNRQWFLPRRAVLDLAVYRVSKLVDAEQHWSMVRPEIEAALREANGRGLPAHFQLDHSPSDWDSYDLFVVAYYWAHRSYDGRPARPRVAHRSGTGTDAQVDLAAGLYRSGVTDGTLAQYDSNSVIDYLTWEALYRTQGLYVPEMFDADGLDDDGVLDGLHRGETFLSTVDQTEAFTLHGGSFRGNVPAVDQPEDLGFVAMPAGASLALDAHGHPARTGRPFSFREEVFWMLPEGGPQPALAYEFVKYVLAAENHVRECEALGIMPMREDVMRERASLFRLPWMTDVFEAGFVQWNHAESVPDALVTVGIGTRYARIWQKLLARADRTLPSRDEIVRAIHAPLDTAAVAGPVTSPQASEVPIATTDDDDDGDQQPEIDPDSWRQRVVLDWGDAGPPGRPQPALSADAGVPEQLQPASSADAGVPR